MDFPLRGGGGAVCANVWSCRASCVPRPIEARNDPGIDPSESSDRRQAIEAALKESAEGW